MITTMFRTIFASIWIGLIIGLSFIETPLKFTAPGITTELGLGIGRIVFIAANIAGFVLLSILTILAVVGPQLKMRGIWTTVLLWATLATQSLIIRPMLAERSDIIIAGGDPGPSSLHWLYIVADLLVLVLLFLYILFTYQTQKSNNLASQ